MDVELILYIIFIVIAILSRVLKAKKEGNPPTTSDQGGSIDSPGKKQKKHSPLKSCSGNLQEKKLLVSKSLKRRPHTLMKKRSILMKMNMPMMKFGKLIAGL
ncbi:hypothetical protein LVD17_18960 [Fulvivirga ulvae]|uniref:hypothetical protein n=1 Tax=Fulvivirga ulvae TaxID=2904245 RepID=UPI001F43FD4C|nr:hypothetical protein [Fulvivirga ulvae]UII30374.1 hypothetical protein LVD17_18960 [Fulvivirga ulvae]